MENFIMSTYTSAEFQKDFQAKLAGSDGIDLAYALKTLGNKDAFSLMNNASLAGMWSIQRPDLTRRNSTSSVSSIAATRNRLNTSPLTSIANIIPEASTATITAAASILSSIPPTEDSFRGRAYSEGANSLSIENALQPQQQPIASSRYKTELCRPFEENGKCKYGDKCQFAHGKQELRQMVRHPKYKTELCRTFHTSGFCPYGPRCHFIHNQEDTTNLPPNKMQNGPTSTGNLTHQAVQSNAFGAAMMPRCAPVAVPQPHISERNHFNHRPSQLDLLKQLEAGSNFGGMSYPQPSLSPPNNSPPYYHGDIGSTVLMSPTSPNSATNGSMFNFNIPFQNDRIPSTASDLASMLSGMPQYEMQHSPPTMSTFDMFRSQGIQETTVNDDSAFETPPDSDRESLTGSPPEKQRLPIFRCLSQSE
ncbi:uncharacterized protein LOC120326993 [Styela clava]|uniref:mRNA decay activator protein ZFP36L1-like n=1 Tax=Styela clava TaxID=7725 RepID=UPI00193ADA2F|nr:mRNA decay activator protein ZFP36L1-like [Styela clava]